MKARFLKAARRIRRFLPALIAAGFFVYCFLVFRTDYRGPDEPLYFAYTQSIVEDFDFNLANDLFLDGRFWGGMPFTVSPKGYYTDYHNHGGVVFWAPFYLYGKLAFSLASACGLDAAAQPKAAMRVLLAVMSFSTLVFALACMFAVWRFARAFFPPGPVLAALTAVYFATPFFFFVITEPANVQVLAAMFYAFGLPLFFGAWNGLGRGGYFLAGLFLGLCWIVKVDLWFLVFFAIAWYAVLLRAGRSDLRRGLIFAAGFMPGLAFKALEDFSRYGCLRQGELSLINPTSFTFFEQLFSSYRGIIYTSPVILLAFCGAWLCAAGALSARGGADGERRRGFDLFVSCLVFALFMKFLLMGFRFFWGGGTPGSRHVLSEYPLLVLLLCALFDRARRRPAILAAVGALTLAALLWNMQMIAQYVEDVDMLFFALRTPVPERFGVFAAIWPSLGQVKDIGFKLLFCGPLCMAVVFGVFVIHFRSRHKAVAAAGEAGADGRTPVWMKVFVVYVCAAYALAGGLNFAFGPKRVAAMRKSAYLSNANETGPERFEDWENLGCLDELIVYFTVRGKWNRVRKLLRTRAAYLGPPQTADGRKSADCS